MSARQRGTLLAAATLSIAAALAAGCARKPSPVADLRGADPERGRLAIEQRQCGVCHVIPGIRGARGHVGPPLDTYSRHVYVAGKFPNEPHTLVRWIRDPPSMAPATAMPALGIGEREARDIASYLYSLP